MESDLISLLSSNVSVREYLSEFPEKTEILLKNLETKTKPAITIDDIDTYTLKILIRTEDRLGFLYSITQIFYLMNLNIEYFDIQTQNHRVTDTFITKKGNGNPFTQRNILEMKSLLEKFV